MVLSFCDRCILRLNLLHFNIETMPCTERNQQNASMVLMQQRAYNRNSRHTLTSGRFAKLKQRLDSIACDNESMQHKVHHSPTISHTRHTQCRALSPLPKALALHDAPTRWQQLATRTTVKLENLSCFLSSISMFKRLGLH